MARDEGRSGGKEGRSVREGEEGEKRAEAVGRRGGWREGQDRKGGERAGAVGGSGGQEGRSEREVFWATSTKGAVESRPGPFTFRMGRRRRVMGDCPYPIPQVWRMARSQNGLYRSI